jgi:hypothetical protein
MRPVFIGAGRERYVSRLGGETETLRRRLKRGKDKDGEERPGRLREKLERLQALLLVPVIRVVGDVAKMIGYPVGLVWRWRNRHRPG